MRCFYDISAICFQLMIEFYYDPEMQLLHDGLLLLNQTLKYYNSIVHNSKTNLIFRIPETFITKMHRYNIVSYTIFHSSNKRKRKSIIAK